jgi:hypothetical protein
MFANYLPAAGHADFEVYLLMQTVRGRLGRILATRHGEHHQKAITCF